VTTVVEKVADPVIVTVPLKTAESLNTAALATDSGPEALSVLTTVKVEESVVPEATAKVLDNATLAATASVLDKAALPNTRKLPDVVTVL